MVAMCALVASASAPPTPFMIYGYVSYENGGACNNPTVNINNTNTSNEWSTEIKTKQVITTINSCLRMGLT
jgi:hypothetical protein